METDDYMDIWVIILYVTVFVHVPSYHLGGLENKTGLIYRHLYPFWVFNLLVFNRRVNFHAAHEIKPNFRFMRVKQDENLTIYFLGKKI